MQANTVPALKLDRTSTPGIYRRHKSSCPRKGKCDCQYVVVTTHRGKQHKTFHATLAEAREAKGDRTGSERQGARSRVARSISTRASGWRRCQGRTARGLDEDTRATYQWRNRSGTRIPQTDGWPGLGSTPLRDIARRDIDRLIRQDARSRARRGDHRGVPRAAAGDVLRRRRARRPSGQPGAAAADQREGRRPHPPTLPRARCDDARRAAADHRRDPGTASAAVSSSWLDGLPYQGGPRTRLDGPRQPTATAARYGSSGSGTRHAEAKREDRGGHADIELDPNLRRGCGREGATPPGRCSHAHGQRLHDRNLRRVLDAAARRRGGVSHASGIRTGDVIDRGGRSGGVRAARHATGDHREVYSTDEGMFVIKRLGVRLPRRAWGFGGACPGYVPGQAADVHVAGSSPPSGHVFRVDRKRGRCWYMKYRLPDGRQV